LLSSFCRVVWLFFPIAQLFLLFFNIVRIQIEIEKIISLTNTLTTTNLEKLIFVSKSSPNDPRVDYESLFNLVNLNEKNLKLKQSKSSFEWDKIVNIWNYRRRKFLIYIFHLLLILLFLDNFSNKKNNFAENNWTFVTRLVRIAFENWLILNLWKVKLKEWIKFLFQMSDTPEWSSSLWKII
jgi:hypothetical protein